MRALEMELLTGFQAPVAPGGRTRLRADIVPTASQSSGREVRLGYHRAPAPILMSKQELPMTLFIVENYQCTALTVCSLDDARSSPQHLDTAAPCTLNFWRPRGSAFSELGKLPF